MSRPSEVLAYVQPFNAAPGTLGDETADGKKTQKTDEDINMFRISRSLRNDGTRRGLIVRLVDIWRPVDVVPKFGSRCPSEWTMYSAVELAKEFYVNCFSDKEVYKSVY